MNDFTKQELEYFDGLLDFACPPEFNYLIKKVKSMIDNYCEHPENMSMYSLGVEYCAKCKRKLNE